MPVERVGVSFEPELLERFDSLVKSKGYDSRSEAIRDLIRKALIELDIDEGNSEVIGTLTYIYDHHRVNANDKLMDLQHAHHKEILFTTHVHMDHDMCLEVLIVKGPTEKVRGLADNIKAIKGVDHGELVITRSHV